MIERQKMTAADWDVRDRLEARIVAAAGSLAAVISLIVWVG